jgi:hypothetical protein
MLCASASLFIYSGSRFVEGMSNADTAAALIGIRSCERRRYILTTDISRMSENRIHTRIM